MKNTQVAMIAIIFVLAQSCASHLPGTQAQEVGVELTEEPKPELQVSVDTFDAFNSKYYRAFVVSFMNNSDHWIKLTDLNARFPKLAQKPTFLLGDDLVTYVESVDRRNKIEQHNRSLILSGLAIVGGAAAAGGKNQDTRLAGLGLVASAATIQAVQEILSSKRKAEFHDSLPDNHFLKPFSIPPGLSMSRWMIVALPEKKFFQEIAIDLTEAGGISKTYTVIDQAQKDAIYYQSKAKLNKVTKDKSE